MILRRNSWGKSRTWFRSSLPITGLLVTLATSAPWLFTGTALVIVIAFARGYRPRLPALTEMPAIANLLEAVRDARPSRSGRVRRR